jgi:integrase/recombinase XerD
LKAIPTVSEVNFCAGDFAVDGFPSWVQRDLEELSDARRETLISFIRDMELRGLSRSTVLGYVKAIRTLDCDGKPYEELTSEDHMAWMERIGSNGWSEGTVNLFRMRVKHFLRWVHGCRSTRDPTPEPLRVIQQRRSRRTLPKGILSRAEIRQLVDAGDNQRDRALVFAGYESGPRAKCEFLGTKIRDVEFDQFGAVLHLNRGKTGERRVRLIECVPDLKLWISMHPNKNDPDAPLWPKLGGGPLGYAGFYYLLEKLGKSIGKHVHPSLLRHSRATHLASVLTEAQMREFFGWAKDSDMPSVYVHLSGRDVDGTLLKHYGMKVEPPTEHDQLEPKMCPWCKTLNSPSARFCQSCNAPLDPASAEKAAKKQMQKFQFIIDVFKDLTQGVSMEEALKDRRKELEQLVDRKLFTVGEFE